MATYPDDSTERFASQEDYDQYVRDESRAYLAMSSTSGSCGKCHEVFPTEDLRYVENILCGVRFSIYLCDACLAAYTRCVQ